MKLQGRAIDDFIRAPSPQVRAVLVYGPDEGQVRERAAAIARKIVPDAGDPFRIAELAPETLTANQSALADESCALSMSGGRRLVLVREATDKATLSCAALAKLDRPGDSLVIVEAGDLSPRSSLRKLFEAEASFAALPCYADDERSLSGLIRETLAADRIQADGDAVAYLAQALLGDRALARRALEKIALYCGPNAKLSLDAAMEIVGDAGAVELDEPARAAAEGDRRETDRAVKKLLEEGTSPVALLRAAQGYFRRLHIARGGLDSGQSPEAVMAALRPPVFFKQAPQFRKHLDRWRLPMIASALNRLVECEAASKRTNAPDELLTARTFVLIAQMLHGNAKSP
jgi:DNA polymerase-3 subunit delta